MCRQTSELMLASMSLRWAWRSHVGNVRELNEDSVLTKPGICVVADGMGGHRAGEVASRLAVQTFDEEINLPPISAERLRDVVVLANDRIRAHASADDHDGMGTTCVGVVVADNGGTESLIAFNIGDSRCYSLVEGTLERLTHDHSEVQELVDAGTITDEQARTHPSRNIVTRALGIDAAVAPEFVVLREAAYQRLLLCSDGLTGEVSDDEIQEHLSAADGPATVVDRLIATTLARRAADNISVIVIDVRRDLPVADEAVAGPADDSTEPRFLVGQIADNAEKESGAVEGPAAADRDLEAEARSEVSRDQAQEGFIDRVPIVRSEPVRPDDKDAAR